jgi:hypothetical protein
MLCRTDTSVSGGDATSGIEHGSDGESMGDSSGHAKEVKQEPTYTIAASTA